MAIWMDRNTSEFTHMGGEGVPWIGQAPFTDEKHIFANLGDGTYYHSGILAIRAAVAANVNITYKILYNDAVAMTGGQPIDGPLTPPTSRSRSRPKASSGSSSSATTRTSIPTGYFASDIRIHHRDELDAVQRELREVPGRHGAAVRPDVRGGEAPPPQARQVSPIRRSASSSTSSCAKAAATAACKSNCVSVAPVETEFGRKRTIDQSSCNKDYSCVKGFCPSFVTVEGGTLRKPPKAEGADFSHLPEPALPRAAEPYNILVTGIGGTGVVTIGALLGMAAHLEGKGGSVLDMTGLAQKNGAVVSHVRIGDTPEKLYATRIAAGEASLVLACDILTSVGYEALAKMQKGVTKALVNTALVMPAQFTREPDLRFPLGSMEQEIKDAVGPGDAEFLDATKLATGLHGRLDRDQPLHGRLRVPARPASRCRKRRSCKAIELNGAAVESNTLAFQWGRLAAVEPAKVAAAAVPAALAPDSQRLSRVARRDDRAPREVPHRLPGRRVRAGATPRWWPQVRAAESRAMPGITELTEAVARYYFKLLAIKDEYEVARLYAETDFVQQVAAQFEGDYKLTFNLAPPIFNKPDPATGEPRKSTYGPWMLKAFGVLAKLRKYRGTALDVFGRTPERRMERAADRRVRGAGRRKSSPARCRRTTRPRSSSRSIPEHIRGYGHVKERHLKTAKTRETALLDAFRAKEPAAAPAVVKMAV